MSCLFYDILYDMNKKMNKRVWISSGLLILSCLVVYINTFPNEFVWDDYLLLQNNQYLENINNIPLFFSPTYWNELHPVPSHREYHPLRTVTFAVDYYFWQDNPAGYHLTNLLLHTSNVLLVFYLITFLMNPKNSFPDPTGRKPGLWLLPLTTALFFAVHPIHTESVTFIKNRSELLAFFFYLSAFLVFAGRLRSQKRTFLQPGLPASLLLFTAGLISKETVLTLPGLILLYQISLSPGRVRLGAAIAGIIPYGLIISGWFWFKYALLVDREPAAEMIAMTLWRHILVVIKTLGQYVCLLVFPVGLNAERVLNIPESVWEMDILFSMVLLSVLLLLTVRAWYASRLLFFGLTWILLTLIPAANIVFLVFRPIAEQRLYLPSLGFCLVLAWLFVRIYQAAGDRAVSKGRVVFLAAGMSLVIVYGTGTIKRNLDWRDAITFFSRTVAANPRSARSHYNIGVAYMRQNQPDKAIPNFKNALECRTKYAKAHFGLGVALVDTGRYREAIAHFNQALQIKPDYADVHCSLGAALTDTGDTVNAFYHLKKALQLEPDFVAAHVNLGTLLAREKKLTEAISHFQTALELAPDSEAAHRNLGITLSQQGRWAEAAIHFKKALRQSPYNAELHYDLGMALAATDRLTQAIHHYQTALKINPDYVDAYNNLGIAFRQAGRLENAIASFGKALAIQEKTLAADHFDKGKTFYNLARSWQEQGDIPRARYYYRQALDIFEPHLGVAHPLTGEIKKMLSDLPPEDEDSGKHF